jgi:hypothetical protein
VNNARETLGGDCEALAAGVCGLRNNTAAAVLEVFKGIGESATMPFERARELRVCLLSTVSGHSLRELRDYGFDVGQKLLDSARAFREDPGTSVEKDTTAGGAKKHGAANNGAIQKGWITRSYYSSCADGDTKVIFII